MSASLKEFLLIESYFCINIYIKLIICLLEGNMEYEYIYISLNKLSKNKSWFKEVNTFFIKILLFLRFYIAF